MMPESHWLRSLQVGVSRHHRCGVRERLASENELQAGEPLAGFANFVAQLQLEIGRDLIVTRPGRMQSTAGLTDSILESLLDVHVHIFELA